MKGEKSHSEAAGADFAEKNAIAQGMAIPRSVPRLTAVESEVKPGVMSVLDLPDEVKKNLVGYADLEMDQLALKTLACFDVPITIDRLVMTLWQVHQYTADRGQLMHRMRKLAKEGYISKVPGTKGTYQLTSAGKALPGVCANPKGSLQQS